MVIYVTDTGSDRTELTEVLVKEGVTYQECKASSERELAFSSTGMVEIQANLPEVIPVPSEFTQGDTELRAWRLPSGKMIITDMNGNLEQIAGPMPRR